MCTHGPTRIVFIYRNNDPIPLDGGYSTAIFEYTNTRRGPAAGCRKMYNLLRIINYILLDIFHNATYTGINKRAHFVRI